MRSNLKGTDHNTNAMGERKESQDDMKQESENDPSVPQWKRWCRLCAKEDERNNINVFMKNNKEILNRELATAIGKYFWVNIKPDDAISQFICNQCHTLVEELITFTERINKVQTMFYLLKNSSEPIDPNELRLQYGLLNEEHKHIMRHMEVDFEEGSEEPDEKPSVIFELAGESDECEEFVDEGDGFHFDEEYKKALKAYENEDVESVNSNKEDPFQENETSAAPHGVDLKKTENEGHITIEVKKTDTKDIENDEIENVIYEYTVRDSDDNDDDGSEDNGGEVDGSKGNLSVSCNENTASKVDTTEAKPENEETVIASKNFLVGQVSRRKRGRPPKNKNLDDSEKRAKVDTESAEFDCSMCPKKYKSIVLYRKHMKEVHNVSDQIEVQYQCDQCEKSFNNERCLRVHSQAHLPLELKQTYPCPYCDKKLTKESILEQHIQGVHLNEKPYVCEECGRALKTNAALKEHKLTHTAECPFECEVCHKRFKNKARLKIHLDIHTNTGYTCEECGLHLNTRRTLTMHMLVHSTATPYKCDHCGNEYKRAKALKNHLIIHTGLKPYVCEFCNKAFANGSNCRSHKKKTHPVELAAAEAQGISSRASNVPKLDHLREVTKNAKNLQPVVKPQGLPLNWREILLKAEAQANKCSSPYYFELSKDEENSQNEDDVHEYVLEPDDNVDSQQGDKDDVILDKMPSEIEVVKEADVQNITIDS